MKVDLLNSQARVAAFVSQSRIRRLGWPALLAFLVYLYHPVWPPSIFEGDDARVAMSVEQIARQGVVGKWVYRFIPFRGTYLGIAAVSGFASVNAFSAYYALSATSAILAFFLAALWVARWCRVPYWAGVSAVVLFPEVMSFSYFANTSAPAFLFLTLAGLFALDSRRWIRIGGGVLLAAAIACRVDALAYLPVFLFLVSLRQKDWWEGVLFCCVTLLTFVVVNPTGLSAVGAANAALSFESWDLSGKVALAFFPVASVGLMAVGVFTLAKKQNWGVLLPCGLALGLSFCSYGPCLTSPRYLIHSLPFAASLVVFGVREMWEQQRKVALGIVSGLLLLQVFWPFSPVVFNTHDGPRQVAPLISNPTFQWRQKKSFALAMDHVEREMVQVQAQQPRDIFAFGHLEFYFLAWQASQMATLARFHYRFSREDPRTTAFMTATFEGEGGSFSVRFTHPEVPGRVDLESIRGQIRSEAVYLLVNGRICTRIRASGVGCPCDTLGAEEYVFMEWNKASGRCGPPRFAPKRPQPGETR